MTRKFSDYNANDNPTLTLLLGKSLPEGLVWNSKADPDSNLYKLLSSLAEEIRALEDRIQRLANQWDIRITTDLINEWETAVGIPDECRDKAADIATRRLDVIDKLRKVPVVTVADYQALANVITGETGWNIRPGSEEVPLGDLPSSAPVGHFKMNDNVASTTVIDSSSNVNNGVADVNTDTINDTGKINGALNLSLNGGSHYITVPDQAYYSFGNGTSDSPFSVATWIYIPPASSGTEGIAAKWEAGKQEWLLYLTNTKLKFAMFDVSVSKQLDKITDVALTTGWHHVAVTYDGSSAHAGINLYVDNVAVSATGSIQAGYIAMEAGSSAVTIGSQNATPASVYPDKIDDVRIYNEELTEANIAGLYNSGNGTEENGPSLVDVAIYKFLLLVGSPAVSSGAFVYPFGNNAQLSVTTLTSSGTTATAAVSSTADMVNGSNVEISGAVETEYNGFYDITITSGTTFDYTFAGSGTSPATGTILVNFGADLPSSLQDASGNDVFIGGGVLFEGYPFAGGFRTDVLKCVFRKVTPANVVVVFD